MFDDEKRSATVELVEDTEVVGILGTDMRRLMREHPDIAPKLVISLGRRLREANERLARQSFQTVQSRVAVVLRDLVDQSRDGEGQTGDVLLRITQADIAQLAGSSRESASRFLATLERAGRAHAGTRTDRGPRSRRARRIRVLVARAPELAGPRVLRRRHRRARGARTTPAVRRDRAVEAAREPARRCSRSRRATRTGTRAPRRRRCARSARRPACRRASSSASGTCATGTSARAGGSSRSSRSSCSSTRPATPSAMSTTRSTRPAGCPRTGRTRLHARGEREIATLALSRVVSGR